MDPSTTIDESAEARRIQFHSMLQTLWLKHEKQIHLESDDILGTLIRTVLAQATNRGNRERAFAELLDTFGGDWSTVANAEVDAVISAIRVGGLAKQKAPRIQQILATVFESFGSYSLEKLADWHTDDAIKFLESLPGVGPKTAAFTLMWSVGADTLAMNTDIFRILRRTGYLTKESDKAAHRRIQPLVPEGASFSTHMVLIAHGRQTCLSRTPICDLCVIANGCEKNGVNL